MTCSTSRSTGPAGWAPGQYTLELARRGWHAVGVDSVPAAIQAARDRSGDDATYLVVDVTDLPAAGLGSFDFFLDIGCFQALDADQRQAAGHGITALANPGATILLLAFSPTRLWSRLGAASQQDIQTAFPQWEMTAVEQAETAGLGWPMNRTAPHWYRLRLRHRFADTVPTRSP